MIAQSVEIPYGNRNQFAKKPIQHIPLLVSGLPAFNVLNSFSWDRFVGSVKSKYQKENSSSL